LINQFKPEQLPALERYGVDYSEYVKAVTQSRTAGSEPPKTK
jgi:phage terminase small subunit